MTAAGSRRRWRARAREWFLQELVKRAGPTDTPLKVRPLAPSDPEELPAPPHRAAAAAACQFQIPQPHGIQAKAGPTWPPPKPAPGGRPTSTTDPSAPIGRCQADATNRSCIGRPSNGSDNTATLKLLEFSCLANFFGRHWLRQFFAVFFWSQRTPGISEDRPACLIEVPQCIGARPPPPC